MDHHEHVLELPSRVLVEGNLETNHEASRVLVSEVSLSFWGGIDPETGIVIDQAHPWHGQCVADAVICLPSGRGSCTASQVLLELIVNKKAPRAIVLRDVDGLVCVGAIIAQSIFPEAKVLDILHVQDFQRLLDTKPAFARVLPNGHLVVGSSKQKVQEKALSSNQNVRWRTSANLSEQERDMMLQAATPAAKRAVECIIRYARIMSDSPTYIDVAQAHIDGCTYIGPSGLEFVKRLVAEGGQVQIPTTLNSVSTDLRHWKSLGIVPTPSQQASIELANAYVSLGCSDRSFTCAPYLLNAPPKFGQQIIWGESNAVVYANSVLGARTEKYADYLDICCALVGKVPQVGVHLSKNRMPSIVLDASSLDLASLDSESFQLLFPVLGHVCGTLSDGSVAIVLGLESCKERISRDYLKAFCAAFGTTGTSPLIHIAGITPVAVTASHVDEMVDSCSRHKTITMDHLESTFASLNQESANSEDRVDLIALGNPHLSETECHDIANWIEKLGVVKRHEEVQVIACISRAVQDQSASVVQRLQDFGITFVNDTCWCMLLHPPIIPAHTDATILTNSGKYAHYGPGLTHRRLRLGSTADCVRAAATGRLPRPASMPFAVGRIRNFSAITVLRRGLLRR